MPADGPHEPHLRHAHDGAEDAEAKGDDGGDAGREEMRGGVDGDVVAADAAFEEEVFGEGDAFVDGKPVALVGTEAVIFQFHFWEGEGGGGWKFYFRCI